MLFYSVTFGGFSGLTSSLTIYFNSQYGLSPVSAGYYTAAACSPDRWCGRWAAQLPTGSAASAPCRSCTPSRPIALVVVSVGLPVAWMALGVFICGMLALGMGNGAVFQLVPQRFRPRSA